ncbi:hypothetical protein HMI55_004365 [Coelomomyces lativittatus]|nr:hypothetical protein HMI55_004365 [Coelomomyces lativittatus]
MQVHVLNLDGKSSRCPLKKHVAPSMLSSKSSPSRPPVELKKLNSQAQESSVTGGSTLNACPGGCFLPSNA